MTTEYLVHQEMQHVFALLMPPNRLICEVCVATGLRLGDVLAFRTARLRPQFWITEQKTRKRRRVNLSADLLARIRAQAGRKWAFESRTDPERHRTRQAVWADVKRAARAFRLPQNVAPHSLRKVYAVEQFERKKGDLDAVKRALNHGSKTTTLIYAMALESYKRKYGVVA